jgi:hypothetical protein
MNAKSLFKQMVLAAPEARPKNLQIGTFSRPAASSLHPAYVNLDRLSNQRRKMLANKKPLPHIGMLATFEDRLHVNIIASSSMSASNGHIALVTPKMQSILQDAPSPIQTDSIEGFLVDEYCPNINVAMSTCFCPIVNRNVPICITILFGKTSEHYAALCLKKVSV